MARILPSTPISDDDETYYLSEVKYSFQQEGKNVREELRNVRNMLQSENVFSREISNMNHPK